MTQEFKWDAITESIEFADDDNILYQIRLKGLKFFLAKNYYSVIPHGMWAIGTHYDTGEMIISVFSASTIDEAKEKGKDELYKHLQDILSMF